MDFKNQAALSYNNHIIRSNVVNGKIKSPFTLFKTSSVNSYGPNSEIGYTILFENSLDRTLSPVQIYDDLGLIYINGTPHLQLDYDLSSLLSTTVLLVTTDGVHISTAGITPPTTDTGVTFSVIMPPKSTAIILYTAKVNSYADIATGSSITNNATYSVSGYDEVTVSNSINVADFSDVKVSKFLYDKTVAVGQPLTYILIVSNYGNTESSTEISDYIQPLLTGISVFADGKPVTEYTFENASSLLTIPSGVITIPPATLTRDGSGKLITTPSSVEISITGTVSPPQA